MRIALVHQYVADDAPAAERDVLVQADAVSASLAQFGHHVTRIAATLDLEALKRQLMGGEFDVLFNLVESIDGCDRLMIAATALFDHLGIPYTGSRTEAIALSNHKIRAKQLLRSAGLPTPDWAELQDIGMATPTLAPPYIIKAISEHASRGIDEASVFTSGVPSDVGPRLHDAEKRLGCRCFAEQYIDGREFNLSLLAGPMGVEVLPPAEIDFSAFPRDMPRIVGHAAKWDAGSFAYENTPRTFELQANDDSLAVRLRELALKAWQCLGLAGYARVDFRVDDRGEPSILEVNANPCLAPDAGFAAAAQRAQLTTSAGVLPSNSDASYDALIERILNASIRS